MGKSLEELAEAFAKKIDGLNLENVGNALDKLDDAAKKKLLNDIENFTDNDLLELEDNIGLLDEYKNISKLDDLEKGKKLPEWLQKIKDGQKFNKEREVFYPYNEIYVKKPNGNGYYRLDSYNPAKGEIISRKFTQFDEITEATGKKYLDELATKYNVDTQIADVPTSQKLLNELAKDSKKPVLQGVMILEIPIQKGRIPQSILDYADLKQIKIRDINGKIY